MLSKVIVTLLLFLVCTLSSAEQEECRSYPDLVKPLLETGVVGKLRQMFRHVNDHQNIVSQYSLFTVEASVLADTNLMKQLISLSRPLLPLMNQKDAWPENNNLPMRFDKICARDETGEEVCSEDFKDFHEKYNPLNTQYAGIRYVHNCKTLQVKSCFRNVCKYNPDEPALRTDAKDIFVPLYNLVTWDGSAITDHLEEGAGMYYVREFSTMAVRECYGRKVFFHGSPDGCFNSTLFFSLPEVVSMRGDEGPHDFLMPKPDYFILFS